MEEEAFPISLVGDQMRIRSVRFEIYRRECGALDLTKALLAFAIVSGIRKQRGQVA